MAKPATLAHCFSHTDDLALLEALVDYLRPSANADWMHISGKMDELTAFIAINPQYREQLANSIGRLIASSRVQYVLSESGILTNNSFYHELNQKLVNKFLPDLLPEHDLRIVIRKIFSKKSDYLWLQQVSPKSWERLLGELRPAVAMDDKRMLKDMLDAAETLSFRIAALGTDKRITQKAGHILEPHNAFVEQNKAWHHYRAAVEMRNTGLDHEYDQINKWIEEGRQQVAAIRQNKKLRGTSLQQTFVLTRIEQQLKRLSLLLKLIEPAIDVSLEEHTAFFKMLVENENTATEIRPFLNRNISFLAFQIAEHGSHTGEKYITTTRQEYWQFFGAAAIGGLIISFAAFLKIRLSDQHLPYFWASFSYGLNYAAAFVIIHFLHGTIATKQPALTASAIANAIDQKGSSTPSLNNLAILNAKVMRSQFASLIGNLIIVIPLTILIAWVYQMVSGRLLVPTTDVDKMLNDIRPSFRNVWFAGIAGVLLYLSGIISGYFDNLVVFADIKRRIQLQRGLKKWFGKNGAENIAAYIDKNLGAIMGNVLLGFGLGFMIFFGKILGVPLDIRHVTISSGFFGFSWFASGFSFDAATLAACAIGLAFIATTNLLVSFTLALFTAMKSRGLRTRQLLPLIKLTGRYFLHFPSHFVYPPRYAGAQP